MNEQQEYIKFWTGIMEKVNEVQNDYNHLSNANKQRADNAKNAMLHANTLADIIQILYEQTK